MCDKVEAHETCVSDYRGSHACQLARDLLGNVRGMSYVIVYTKLSGRVGLKMFAV